MTKPELAQGLVELWGEYLANISTSFPPTMTDFIGWMKNEHEMPETEQEVNPTRTKPALTIDPSTGEVLVSQEVKDYVKSLEANEASVAQDSGGDTLGVVDRTTIRRLYQEGMSAARIRQRLGLNVTIGTIFAVATKKL